MNAILVLTPILCAIIVFVVLKLKEMDIQICWAGTGIAILVCSIVSGIGYWIGTSHSRYDEIWNLRGVSMKYEMRWTTHETRTESYTTGSGKNKRTHTKTIHYTEKHGPYWHLYDECGGERDIDESEYQKWKQIWGNERQTGMHRGSSAGLDRSIDGPIFEIFWDNTFDKSYPISDIHTYVNKVRASKNSIFKHKKPSEELKKKYPRPADEGNICPIINISSSVGFDEKDILLLRRCNAVLGVQKEIHAMFILIDAKAGMGIVDDILSAWESTNKNELAVFLGVDNETKTISWVKCESWMDNTTLYGYMNDSLLNKPCNSRVLADSLLNNVPRYWHRKSFKEFDYLHVEVSKGGYIFTFIADIVSVIAIIFVVIYNNENGYRSSYGYRRRW